MGQYFNWTNFDKGEFIDTDIWPNGQKLVESAYYGCEETDAALTMLAGEWAGDFVCFLGDYADFRNNRSPAAERVLEAMDGRCAEDYFLECAKDIQGRFDFAKTNSDFRWYDFEEGKEKPFIGPFDITIQRFRYVINESKHEYIDREQTAVRYIDPADGEIVRYDPFPEYMSSEDDGFNDPENKVRGLWLGDVIRPSHKQPSSEYKKVGHNYSYWAPPVVNASDDEIRSIISDNSLNISDENILDQIALYLR